MQIIENILSQELVQRLGWTLVHFVWQATAIGLVLAIVLRLLHKSSANLRYVIACAALALIVLMPAITIRMVDVSVGTIEPVKQVSVDLLKVGADTQPVIEMPQVKLPPAQVAASPKVPLKDRFIEAVEPALPFIVAGWLLGVFGLSLWHLGGWRQLQRLRRQMVKQVAPHLKTKLQHLSNVLGIQKTVGLVESALVQVPAVVGHFKPVILLPASALTGLSPEQIEAILAHELAHIKRCDYLVNMLQTVVEILGFYHPAVWWVSHKIRIERENCCDDIAVSICSDRVCYARALTTMEQIRIDQPALAVAASGGSLFNRIRRLLGKDSANEGKLSWLPSVIVIVLIAALLIPTALALSSGKSEKVDVENDRVRVYQVNRNVSDFPGTEDFSTPESAYAAINRVMAADDPRGWQRVSIKSLADRLAKKQQRKKKKKADTEWSKVVLNARILEVRIKDNIAAVIAKFPQVPKSKPIRNPVDYRHLELEDGKWLNTGEDRYDSIEQARAKFDKMVKKQSTEVAKHLKIEQKYSEVLEKPDVLLNFTEELFEKIRKADYDKILSYYDEQTDKWRWGGWKKLGLDYMVHTDWPSFAVWVCRTFKDNPIESVELGKVFISDKQVLKKIKAPAVPYRVVLQDGGILDGDLYFVYWDKSEKWQAVEGIDWHLQDDPIKRDNLKAALKRTQKLQKRTESFEKLKRLGVIFSMYAAEHDQKYPDSLNKIKPYDEDEILPWVLGNVRYFGHGKTTTTDPPALVAYDRKMLLEKGETNVLFNDAHVKFCNTKKLKDIGIDAGIERRLESAIKLKRIGTTLLLYVVDHQDQYPDTLEELKLYGVDQELALALENVEYLGKGKRRSDSPQTLVAYDKTLPTTLERGGTNVLYHDGHVSFERIETLEELGITIEEKSAEQNKDLSNENIVKAFDELITAVREHDSAKLREIALKQAEAFNFTDAEKEATVDTLQLDAKALRTYEGIENLEIFTIQEQNGRRDLLTSKVTDARGVAGRLSFGVFGKDKVILDGFGFVTNDGTRLVLRPQTLTTGYILSVPADLPQLKEIISDDKSKSRMITSEKLDEFLSVIGATSAAKIIAMPKLLTSDGTVGEIRIENVKDFESIKFNIKNTVGADRKTVKLELDFEYREKQDLIVTATKTTTEAAVLSDHAIAVTGNIADKDQILLLIVKPQILKRPFSKTGVVQVEDEQRNIIHGIVCDQSGNPVFGALVLPMPHGGHPVKTGTNGEFELAGPSTEPGRTIKTLFVRDINNNLAAAVPLDNPNKPLDITLTPAVTLTGCVTDPQGKPFAKVRVSPSVYDGQRWHAVFGYTVFQPTDSNGYFKIKALPVGQDYEISVGRVEGYGGNSVRLGILDMPGRKELDDIVLEPANLSVSGVVLDDNLDPMAGVNVRASSKIQLFRGIKTDSKGRFKIDGVCKGQVKLDAWVSDDLWSSDEAKGGDSGIEIYMTKNRRPKVCMLPPENPPVSLVGKTMPGLETLGIHLPKRDIKGKRILVCFWKLMHDESRECIRQLAARTEELAKKNIVIVAVQIWPRNEKQFRRWLEKNNVKFPVSILPDPWKQKPEQRPTYSWGMQNHVPWLILTDAQHVVQAEDFALSEL